MIDVRVDEADFDPAALLDALGGRGGGAVASFVGHVRGDGGLTALTLTHYPAMTERALHAIAEEAVARWDLLGATIVHRVGRLEPGARIVFAGAAARHRAAALEACAAMVERLKTDAPFWKKERFGARREVWVEPS